MVITEISYTCMHGYNAKILLFSAYTSSLLQSGEVQLNTAYNYQLNMVPLKNIYKLSTKNVQF